MSIPLVCVLMMLMLEAPECAESCFGVLAEWLYSSSKDSCYKSLSPPCCDVCGG